MRVLTRAVCYCSTCYYCSTGQLDGLKRPDAAVSTVWHTSFQSVTAAVRACLARQSFRASAQESRRHQPPSPVDGRWWSLFGSPWHALAHRGFSEMVTRNTNSSQCPIYNSLTLRMCMYKKAEANKNHEPQSRIALCAMLCVSCVVIQTENQTVQSL